MWRGGIFRRSRPEPLDFSPLVLDFHSHLVPGVDDGAPDMETALAMVDGLVSLGYRGAVTTPHIYPGVYPNSAAGLQLAFAPLLSAVTERHPGFALHLAAEYQIDDDFVRSVEAGEEILAHNKLVLVEVGFHAAPPDGLLEEAFFALQKRDFTPVLAHVERYPYWHRQLNVLSDLEARGVILQVNAASLAGAYGPEVQAAGTAALSAGIVGLVGSDAHGPRHISALESLQNSGASAVADWLSTAQQAHLLGA
jgi:protein-tyrosine phosphatase